MGAAFDRCRGRAYIAPDGAPRELSDRAARSALDDLMELPLRRAQHHGLLDRAWSLRENVSFYDGLYIALAERLDLPLLTLDARLARAPGVRAGIEVVA